MTIISKTFCPLPFNHIYIHPQNRAQVCCGFNKSKMPEGWELPNIKDFDKLSDYLQHPNIKDIQQKMLKGEEVAGCATCYYAEKNGYDSMRQKELKMWYGNNHTKWYGDDWMPEPDIENPKLNFVEITFGNYCNLACRTCDSDLSHSWLDDNKRLEKYVHEGLGVSTTKKRLNIEREWEDDDFKDLEYLKITGGEPMLHPDWFKFANRFDPTNVKMFIFTNTSWVPKKRHLDLLKKFKHCQIFMSIDGTGSVQEYMRHNSNWDITEKSARAWLQFMKENDNIQVSWAPTWSLMNANYFIETVEWWLETINEILGQRADDCGAVKTNFIFGPSEYQIGNLPEENKHKLKKDIQEFIDTLVFFEYGTDEIHGMSESFLKYLNNHSEPKKDDKRIYYRTTELLDEWREQSVETMLPKTHKAMYIDTIL